MNMNLVVQLKNNQANLFREVRESCAYYAPQSKHEEIEKNRNRIEARVAEVFDVRNGLIESKDWNKYISNAIRVTRKTEWFDHKKKVWRQREEQAFYLSLTTIDASTASEVIRKHWHCENRNHYVRDVSLGEDASRIRTNPGVFARLRSFSLNLLRFNR